MKMHPFRVRRQGAKWLVVGLLTRQLAIHDWRSDDDGCVRTQMIKQLQPGLNLNRAGLNLHQPYRLKSSS